MVFTGRFLTLNNYTAGLLTIIALTFCTNWRWWSEILTMLTTYTKVIFTWFCSYNESRNWLSDLKAITPLLMILVRKIFTDTITNPVGNYMFKVNNRNTRRRCEIYSKLTIKIPERRLFLCTRPCFQTIFLFLMTVITCNFWVLIFIVKWILEAV